MWQISLKAPQAPVKIPDVMEEYRTTSRILRKLAGKKLDNGQTIFKVSRFFMSKLVMMTHHVDMIQSHICEAMGIDESQLDKGLETLQLVRPEVQGFTSNWNAGGSRYRGPTPSLTVGIIEAM